jgi:hypothetical protein
MKRVFLIISKRDLMFVISVTTAAVLFIIYIFKVIARW